MLDAGKFWKIAAPAGDVGKVGNLRHRCIRVWSRGELSAQHQFWNTHRLVDENLLLVLGLLAPLQNRFDGDDGGFKFQRALQKQSSLERSRWIFAASFDNRDRHRFGDRLRMSNQ